MEISKIYRRREFFKMIGFGVASLVLSDSLFAESLKEKSKRPNILFVISDDQSYPHAGIYGDPIAKTPTFDKLAKEGILFNNVFSASPVCTPSRGAVLAGQECWRLEGGANLWSMLPGNIPVYPKILEKAGYFVGMSAKGYSPPHRIPSEEWPHNPAGKRYENFDSFLKERPENSPFCYWFGSFRPHRPYPLEQGLKAGLSIDDVKVPSFLPDTPTVRSDMLDYYESIRQFDNQLTDIINLLEKSGESDNTIVIVTSDNGMPWPHAKANLNDWGLRVPLVIRWPDKIQAGRVNNELVSLTDIAPTFLEAVGVKIPGSMTGHSLMPLLVPLESRKSGVFREFVTSCNEMVTPCRRDMLGYPCRTIRTHKYRYTRNYAPDRWPAGDPDPNYNFNGKPYGDVNEGPTKTEIMEKRAEYSKLFELSFGKRPVEELYDICKDPDQINNVASDPQYASILADLRSKLTNYLKETEDPRETNKPVKFDEYPYFLEKSWGEENEHLKSKRSKLHHIVRKHRNGKPD